MTPPSPPARHRTGTGQLLVDVAGAVAVVTINNPGKRNALSSEIRAALPGLLEALQADGDVRAVVLTGAGDKAFASGADISEFAERRTSPAARAEYDRAQEAIYDALASLEKPVIAMIRGYCLGQGLLTAVRADIRIASDDSQFGIPAAGSGSAPASPAWRSWWAWSGRPPRRRSCSPPGDSRRRKPSRWAWSTASSRPQICGTR